MSKPFIPVAYPDLHGNEEKYIKDAVNSTWISSRGKYLENFEKEFAKYIGAKYAISTNSGTSALHLAIHSMGIGPGDEVIVPDLTFVATANTVSYTGAKPIFVDVEKKSWNIDPEKIISKITRKTRAIIAVHLYGHPADMVKILDIARRYNLKIIEDAAEAHGAQIILSNHVSGIGKYKWKKVGIIGDAGCFSFYGNKIITTGEGGMVTTDNDDLAVRIRILRDHGQKPGKRYYYEVIGFNYRMTNIQAALGLAQLERIEEFLNKKRKIAGLYNRLLKNIPGIILPPKEENTKDVCWMYSVLIDKPYPKTRDQIIDILKKENIESRPFFYCLHALPPYYSKEKYHVSEFLSSHGLNLPSGTNISEREIRRITDIIRKISS